MSTIPQQITLLTDQNSILFYFFILVIIILVVTFIKLRISKRQRKTNIVFLGERFSGKTSLWTKINGGKQYQTVPSIKNNHTQLRINGRRYMSIDYVGDDLSKQEVLQNMKSIHTIIQVVDGTDFKALGRVALLMYRILSSKQFQQDNCNYLIILNKQNDPNYCGRERIIKKIEDEIEHIKITRKNQGQDNDGENDELKTSKTRFNLGNVGIKIFSESLESKNLSSVLNNIC